MSNKIIINPDGYYPVCPNCYEEVDDIAEYCHKCGTKLDWSILLRHIKENNKVKARRTKNDNYN